MFQAVKKHFVGIYSIHRHSSRLYGWLVYGLSLLLFGMLAASIFVTRSLYANDYPYFREQNVATVVSIIGVVVVSLLVYVGIAKLNIAVSKKIMTLVVLLAALLQLAIMVLLPLKPAFDMQAIQQVALQLTQGNTSSLHGSGYLATQPNNLLLTLLSAGLDKLGANTVVVLKLSNILATSLTTLFGYQIFKRIFKRDNLFALLLLAFFPAAMLYVNQVYTDVPAAMLFTISLWLYLKNNRWRVLVLVAVLLVLGTLLRPVGALFALSIALYELLGKERQNYKKGIGFAVFYFIALVMALQLSNSLLTHPRSTPAVSYVYMGLNTPLFGFNDGSADSNRSWHDVIRRLQTTPARTTGALTVKKEVWMWTEGTYASQRYGIGLPTVAKYSYETELTGTYRRQMIADTVIHGIYLLNAALLLLATYYLISIRKLRGELLLIVSLFVGFGIFYIFWEMKSRYVYALYPYLVMVAVLGLDQISSRIVGRGKN